MLAFRRVLFLLALPAFARAAPLADPFAGPRTSFTTAAGGTGSAMDVALSDGLAWLLDQDPAHEDQLVALERPTGKVVRRIGLGARGACAVTVDHGSPWILRRGRQDFLRRLDGNGNVVEALTPDELPPGKLYGLALDAKAFYFSASDADRSRIYQLDRSSRAMRELASLDGRVLGLAFVGGRLYASLSHAESLGDQWLVALRPDGTVEARLRLPFCAMGLDHDGTVPVAMVQHGPEADVVRLVPDLARRLLIGPANLKHVRVSQVYEGAPGVPVVVKATASLPQELEFQRIRNFSTNATVRAVTVDHDGNRWGTLEVAGTGRLLVTMEMDVAAAGVTFTVDPDAAPPIEAFPREALDHGLGETSAFDYTKEPVQRLIAAVPRAPSLAGLLLNVHDAIGDALQIVGPSGREVHASDFLAQGVGRCYAHTLAFSAVARGLGLPVRAIGGIQLVNFSSADAVTEASVHTWNQAYLPGNGWVDIDSQRDDHADGTHGRAGFGHHPDDYVLTFVGAYGEKDGRTQFAERDWIRSGWEGFSTDPSRHSGLGYRGLEVEVSDLASW